MEFYTLQACPSAPVPQGLLDASSPSSVPATIQTYDRPHPINFRSAPQCRSFHRLRPGASLKMSLNQERGTRKRLSESERVVDLVRCAQRPISFPSRTSAKKVQGFLMNVRLRGWLCGPKAQL